MYRAIINQSLNSCSNILAYEDLQDKRHQVQLDQFKD